MIDYGLLCHYIDSWKAGQRPNPGYMAQRQASVHEPLEEVDSGVVELADDQQRRW